VLGWWAAHSPDGPAAKILVSSVKVDPSPLKTLIAAVLGHGQNSGFFRRRNLLEAELETVQHRIVWHLSDASIQWMKNVVAAFLAHRRRGAFENLS